MPPLSRRACWFSPQPCLASIQHCLPTQPGSVQQHLLSPLLSDMTDGHLINQQTSDDMMYDYLTFWGMTHIVIKGFCRRYLHTKGWISNFSILFTGSRSIKEKFRYKKTP